MHHKYIYHKARCSTTVGYDAHFLVNATRQIDRRPFVECAYKYMCTYADLYRDAPCMYFETIAIKIAIHFQKFLRWALAFISFKMLQYTVTISLWEIKWWCICCNHIKCNSLFRTCSFAHIPAIAFTLSYCFCNVIFTKLFSFKCTYILHLLCTSWFIALKWQQ